MKHILAVLLCAASALATTVTDTVRVPNGTTFVGSVFVKGPMVNATTGGTFASPTGTVVTEGFLVAVTNGAFTLSLVPTDTLTPSGAYYLVTYRPQNAAPWTEKWIVPTSASPVLITTVRVATVPSPGLSIQPSQIAQAGATTNQAMCWNGSWAPGDCGGSSGGQSFTCTATAQASVACTHNFGTTMVFAACYEDGGSLLSPLATATSANVTTLDFGVSVTASCALTTAAARLYSFSVSNAQTAAITGATHGLGHLPRASCSDGSGAIVEPMASADANTFDISLDFGAATTATCTLY